MAAHEVRVLIVGGSLVGLCSAIALAHRGVHVTVLERTPPIGAFEHATVGWFDRETEQYRRIAVDEQCELLSLVGDVAVGEDGPALHMHVVLGLSDGTTRGGHLLEARVYPTLEAVVTENPAYLRKVLRPDIGIALIDLDQSQGVT